MSEEVKKNYFTTGQMRNALIQIEDKMVHSNWMPNIILGINRGGCIPGVYLSHRLKTAHEVLDVRLRDHTAKPNLTVLEKAFAFQKKILIIDDINDSGNRYRGLPNVRGDDYLASVCSCGLEASQLPWLIHS